jgi:DNA-binding CsgD family transcriptional regulator
VRIRALSDLLSPRQLELARLLADGCSNREIGNAMGITLAGVKGHLQRIYEKLGTGGISEVGSQKEGRIMLAIRYDREFSRSETSPREEHAEL